VSDTKQDLEQEIAALKRRRDELRARLASIENDYRTGLSADSEEQAIQLENAEVQEGIAKATADELARIEERLEELG
jgi:predicted  nucleic acid-binding Zn-ribbon protein